VCGVDLPCFRSEDKSEGSRTELGVGALTFLTITLKTFQYALTILQFKEESDIINAW
jgi:hypothetical protein